MPARIAERGLVLGPDTRRRLPAAASPRVPDGQRAYFLDRLLTAGIVEARGCERFGLVAAALPAGALKDFYRELARSEVRHQELYIDLARLYFAAGPVAERLEELLDRRGAGDRPSCRFAPPLLSRRSDEVCAP